MRTLASSNNPSESSPQTRSHPSPSVCGANCCYYTGATGCLGGPLLLYHLAPSLHLQSLRCSIEVSENSNYTENFISYTSTLDTYDDAYRAQMG